MSDPGGGGRAGLALPAMKMFRVLFLLGISALSLVGVAASPAGAMRDPFPTCIQGPCLPPIIVCVREPCP